MAFTRKLDRLVPDLAATLIRFPVPAAIAAAACLILNIAKIRFDNEAWQIVVTAACAFLAAGAAHLFGEGRQFGRARSAGLALAAGRWPVRQPIFRAHSTATCCSSLPGWFRP